MCPYIRKGQNINGWYYYCDAVAFGLRLSSRELEAFGCTPNQRETCKILMEAAVGVGMVPEPNDEP